ncbi:MAG TPA: S8 family serine peptidase [Chloroflexota bacterium]|nr:S8 family serine peptidase [Chloroflexota bacterium]
MRLGALSLAAAGLLLASTASGSAQAAPAPDAAGYVVVLRDDVIDPGAVAARHGLTTDHAYSHAIKGFAVHVPPGRLAALAADPQVRFVAEDSVLRLAGQTTPTGVERIGALQKGAGRSAVDADVAILDTGIDPRHPELNVAGGYNCTSKDATAWADDTGHGTLMAGVVGARNDAVGVVGVAPGARLWAVKVGGAKGAKTSDVVCGLDWVAARAGTIKVASISLSGPGADDGNCGLTKHDPLHQAICRATAAGLLSVAAAGNEGTDLAGSVPAAYREVLTVTAMADYNGRAGGGAAPTCRPGTDDSAADFSNYTTVGSSNASHVIAAPGVCITSTAVGGGYATVSGTSPATPHVAGTVARCLASGACRGLTPGQMAAKVLWDAARRPSAYGFAGDPNSPVTAAGQTRYYGWLVYTGGY